MTALVLYDSAFGNTAQIAAAIARALGQHGDVALAPVERARRPQFDGVDLLVLGCPTQYHALPPALGPLLDRVLPGAVAGLPLAVFDTRYALPVALAGSAAQVLARTLRKLGACLLLPLESFFVTAREGPLLGGERDRAAHWAEAVRKRLTTLPPGTVRIARDHGSIMSEGSVAWLLDDDSRWPKTRPCSADARRRCALVAATGTESAPHLLCEREGPPLGRCTASPPVGRMARSRHQTDRPERGGAS